MADSALQRKNMVESQVRPSDVTDRRITAAMQDIAREAFVPAEAKALAYMDGAVPVSAHRAMLAPRTFARLMQLANVSAGDAVLVVGALTGYAAAVLARMAKSVVALEADESLASAARSTLSSLGAANVTVVTGALEAGHAAKAPYDVIFVEGSIEIVPEALVSQLGQGGRLVAIERAGQGLGAASVLTKTGSVVSRRVAFEAAAPALPGFALPKGFEF